MRNVIWIYTKSTTLQTIYSRKKYELIKSKKHKSRVLHQGAVVEV